MKKNIHPDFNLTTIHCACGKNFIAGSTKNKIKVEVCSTCHPFFTGKQKLVDAAGRVERFYKKYSHLEKFKSKANELEASRQAKSKNKN